jgi:hypothetical protein
MPCVRAGFHAGQRLYQLLAHVTTSIITNTNIEMRIVSHFVEMSLFADTQMPIITPILGGSKKTIPIEQL